MVGVLKKRHSFCLTDDMMPSRRDRAAGARPLHGMNILIAEDDWLLADTLAVLLEERGARIIGPTPSTSVAITLAAKSKVDFALVDMNLQDSFSDPLVDTLQAHGVPFAILTAYRALPTNCGEHAVALLHKPIDQAQLFDVLKRFAPGATAS
jgi:CheY-like chemotaxis protein